MAENPNTTLFDNEICTMNDGKLFSETARLICTTSCARLVCDIKSSRAKTRPQPDHLLWPCKVAKHHADACTTADLYHRVGSLSEPPEPPPAYGPVHQKCKIYVLVAIDTRGDVIYVWLFRIYGWLLRMARSIQV